MVFFKILNDDQVTGCVFLKWNTKRRKMNVCDPDYGQYVQSFKEDKIYRAYWLKPVPEGAPEYELSDVVVIDHQEYEDLKTLLSEGENVPNSVVEPVVEEEHVEQEPPQESEEKPLSLAEMRAIIAEQQKQISMLMEQLNH